MRVDRLWLTDFRSYESAELQLAPGLTAIVGANGEGKTNLVEAIVVLATTASFRGAPTEALVRAGASAAIVRGEGERDGRQLLVEVEITPTGRTRAQVNRQRVARTRDLLDALRVTVFAPDDLDLVKGGPAGRRRYLDDLLVAVHPRHDATRRDLDRVLRQRNALLKQAGGRLDEAAAATLDVWDARLATAGAELGRARRDLIARLVPVLSSAYDTVADTAAEVEVAYEPTWLDADYASVLAEGRQADVRRGLTLVGPHRDEVDLSIGGLPARTHASQGEQRSLAFALRIAGHELVTEEIGVAPILVLDDVFSELDPQRSRALLEALPPGQTILTTAGVLPEGAAPDRSLRIAGGRIVEGDAPVG
ncbi:DNA replication/repair protein RecF [Actinomarinicola tropica]|uniref:DNA replication and repair protein RecF n=1 Tax=Actinomarinicola tropica TaxID=2789776 RepID=A0A5Q2RD85_9ACTN|nr:DNA replication/repair protein RecF [Actinomarinicola tropica]QGG93623.1 DNA replication/repair protein RecF [Actinomarinicola tropica]